MNCRLRPMQLSDVEAVCAIEAASPQASNWSGQAYEVLLANPVRARCRVAQHKDIVVGFACFRVVRDEAELLNVAVLPSFHRQAVGSQLLEGVLEEATEAGAKRIWLEVREGNQPAFCLYEKFGFVLCGQRPAYYANPLANALVLHRSLPYRRRNSS